MHLVVDRSADQFCACCASLPLQFVELLDLLFGELNLRLYQHALPLSDMVSASWIMDFIIGSLMRANAMKGRRLVDVGPVVVPCLSVGEKSLIYVARP